MPYGKAKARGMGKILLHEFPLPEQLALKDRVLARSAEGITIVDARFPDMPLIYVNEGFERLTGYSPEEVLGRNCRFLQGDETDSSAAQEIRRALRERRECTVEILNYRKDGTRFWNRLALTPIQDDAGQLTHYIGIQSDITARKEAEEQLKAATQNLEMVYRRMKSDLEMAARIQRTLLPSEEFRMKGVKLAWLLRPCDELAGDALNLLNLDGRHLGVYMIDVSGHGVGAALLSVTLSRVLTPQPDQSCLFRPLPGGGVELCSPSQVADYLNRQFPMDLRTTQYFTFFYGVLNTHSGEFRYINAGHPAPILAGGKASPSLIRGSGFPVGMLPEPDYQEESLKLKVGQRLYLYTDGVIEASDSNDQDFGTKRLMELVRDGMGLPLDVSIQRVAAAVEQWCAPAHPLDDISLLALEWSPEAE